MAEGTFLERDDAVSSVGEGPLIYGPVDFICGLRAILSHVFSSRRLLGGRENCVVLPIPQFQLTLDIQCNLQIAPESTWSFDREIWGIRCASNEEPLELDHGVRLQEFDVTMNIERELAQGMRAECSVILNYPVMAPEERLYHDRASVTFSYARGIEGWNINLVTQAVKFLRECLQEALNPTVFS